MVYFILDVIVFDIIVYRILVVLWKLVVMLGVKSINKSNVIGVVFRKLFVVVLVGVFVVFFIMEYVF